MGKVVSRQTRVKEVADMLESGMERKDVLQKFTKKYKVSGPSVDKYIKEAKVIVAKRFAAKEAARVNATTQAVTDAVNESLISDLALEGILCTIATANMKVEELVRGEAIIRGVTPFEQIAAIDKLFRKRGTYAPLKNANTDSKGNDVVPFNDGQLDKLINALRENKKP